MKTKLVLFSMFLCIIMSCKKGDTGPQGVQGPQGSSFTLTEGGFIQGTLTGMRSDGTPFTVNFNFKHAYDHDSFYGTALTGYNYSMERYAGSNPLTPGYCRINFDLTSLSSTTPNSASFDGEFYQDLGNNRTFIFDMNTGPLTITAFSYNTSTHIAQGSFQMTISDFDNSTGNMATLNGSFQSVAVTEYVARMGN